MEVGGSHASLAPVLGQMLQSGPTVFTDAAVVDLALDQFRFTADEQHYEILVYCFMPDHVHFLIAGTDAAADFRRFVRLAKQRAGWRYKQQHGRLLWQEGYYERVLRSDESTLHVTTYILGNPIRAGLVEWVEDYPFWGSDVYNREELIEYLYSRT